MSVSIRMHLLLVIYVLFMQIQASYSMHRFNATALFRMVKDGHTRQATLVNDQ